MKPLVSIACITYNHEDYIRQCLDGLVMQKTNFSFEIVIHDDASTDATASIIKEYCNNYPELFVPILQSQNKYKEGKGILLPYVYPQCNGKYIALCEGDDFWIDPLKLQKQIDFLEKNDNYSMCFHSAKVSNESNYNFSYGELTNRQYSVSELFDKWIVPTASIVFKKEIIKFIITDPRIINSDILLVLACAHQGNIYGMKDPMSVYRVHNNGLTLKRVRENNIALQFSYLAHYKCLYDNYKLITYKSYSKKIADTYLNLSISFLRSSYYIKSLCYLICALLYNPIQVFRRVSRKIAKYE